MTEAEKTELVEHVCQILWGPGVDSDTRLPRLLDLTEGCPHDVFLRVFCERWSGCDDTWAHRSELLRRLRATRPLRHFADDRSKKFFDDLPDLIEVFRGCSLERARGLSWTTSHTAASNFARGHRSIAVPNAVIAHALIPKALIFTVFTDREEEEVVLDPRRLRRFTHDPYRHVQGAIEG